MVAGSTYYVYMDATGTIGSTSTRSTALFKDNIVLLEAMIDSSGAPNVIVVNEAHPYTFPVETSEWAHDTIGAVISNKNNGANITLNGTKAIQINGADELEDHGLETDIPDSGGAAENFSFMYTNAGGKWVRNAIANTFPSDYNNAGVVTALGVNKYGIFRLFVSKDNLNSATPTFYAVYDTQQYNNLVQAQTAVANNSPAGASAELAQLELAQLGFVIKEESSDTIVDVIIEKSTARSGTSGFVPNLASLVTTDTTNFDGFLSAADTNVQSALDTLDEVQKGTTFLGTVNAPTFDTNIPAAGVTLSGTTLAADGTDANIPINITAKGTEDIVLTAGASGDVLTATNLRTQRSEVGGSVLHTVKNLDTTSATSNATLQIRVQAPTSGDAFMAFQVQTGGALYSLGIDNSDSDKLKISNGATPSGGTKFLELSTSGEIIKPLQPAFFGYQATDQLNATGAGTSYTLGTTTNLTEVYDRGSNFDPTTGVFTAPVTGIYQLSAAINVKNLVAAMTRGEISIVTSNRTWFGTINNAFAVASVALSQASCYVVSILADMDAADTATAVMTVYGGAGDTATIGGSASALTYFCGTLIC